MCCGPLAGDRIALPIILIRPPIAVVVVVVIPIVVVIIVVIAIVAVLITVAISCCGGGATKPVRSGRVKVAKTLRGALTVVPAVLAVVVALSCVKVSETIRCPLTGVIPTISIPLGCLRISKTVSCPLTVVVPAVLAVSFGRLKISKPVRGALAVVAVPRAVSLRGLAKSVRCTLTVVVVPGVSLCGVVVVRGGLLTVEPGRCAAG